MRFCFVSRELHPHVGGGIAPIVAAAAARLAAAGHEVAVVTSAAHRADHERRRAASDPALLPPSVRYGWVEEPDTEALVGAHLSYMHAYSHGVLRTLRELYGDRGPDLIEFCDYLGEGFVTIQARHTGADWLRDTVVAVRLHTTSELTAVLDGYLPADFASVAQFDGERYALRHADRILWSGGDVLETYRRFYGRDGIAPDRRIPDAFLDHGERERPPEPPPDDGILKLLYVGRFERRKGVRNLVRAFAELPHEDVELTLLGADTDTGPLGTSVRDAMRLAAGGDQRVTFAEPVERHQVGALIARHDVVVIPSLWECWPNVGREALMHNRPILATPVGGLTEMVQEGRSGWLAAGTHADDLVEALVRVADDWQGRRALIRDGGPRAVFEELTDPEAFVAAYEALAAEGRAPRRARATPRSRPPLVSVVVPYFRLEGLVHETLASVAAQTHPAIEVVLVNDGSLREEDAPVLGLDGRDGIRVVTQPNAGLGAARNFGVSQARGEFVLPLDADDTIAPTFVERCVAALDEDTELAYATTWVQYTDPAGRPVGGHADGYLPFGNWSRLMTFNNVGGVCTALTRRTVFERGFRYSHELTSYEDWLLFWELHEAGLHGAVIPERLFNYRVRDDSMMRQIGRPSTERLVGELRAHLQERAMTWTARR